MPPPPNVEIDPELWRSTKYLSARYREVHALLIGLEGDSRSAQRELHDLDYTLRKDYAIVTRMIQVPANDRLEGEKILEYEIGELEFLLAAPDILLLVFFDGRSTALPEFNLWGKLKPLFACHADVIAIFHEKGGQAAPEVPDIAEGGNVAEIIRTYPNHDEFPESKSFTFHVARALHHMSEKVNFTAAQFATSLSASLHQDDLRVRRQNDQYEGRPVRELLCIKFACTRRPTKQEIVLIPFRVKDVERYTNTRSRHKEYFQRWGPLGALPKGWEKRIDNEDAHWRPYYLDNNTGTRYWTRPWSSVCADGYRSAWQPAMFAAHGAKALSQKLMQSRTLMRIATYADFQDKHEFEADLEEFVEHMEVRKLPEDRIETAFQTFLKWAAALEKSDNLIIKTAEKDGMAGIPAELMATARGKLRKNPESGRSSDVEMITRDLADL